MPLISDFVRTLRPAPVASAVAHVLGLSKRRIVQTPQGRFFANPMSRFGHKLQTAEYEPGTTAVLTKCLEPGHLFIDLGANEGYFSVIASGLVGPGGTVFAVEPQARLQAVLRANFSLNHADNVRLVNAVISDRTETMQLHLASTLNNGGSSLFRPTRYPLMKQSVQSVTLAEFLKRNHIGKCDLMKVDIEGGEYDVFMNADETLKSGILRRIALDIHHALLERRGLSGERLHAKILDCGYTLDAGQGMPLYTFHG